MKAKKILLGLALVMVVFAAVIAIFVYKTFSPSGKNEDTKDFYSQPNSPDTSNTILTPTTTPVISQPKPQTDANSAIDECVALKTSEASGKNYERGSLIVSFDADTSYTTAVNVLTDLNLSADASRAAKDNFSQYHWLSVYVPKGEEFKWQCLLDAADHVKRANLNITFNLSQ